AAGNYLLVSPTGVQESVVIKNAYETPQLLVEPAGVGPTICDVDGDGENDLVATIADDQGRPACVILDGKGKEKQRLELLPGMAALNCRPNGRVGAAAG